MRQINDTGEALLSTVAPKPFATIRCRDIICLLGIGLAQVLVTSQVLPAITPTFLAMVMSAWLAFSGEGLSLLVYAIATMSIVNVEPAPTDIFLATFASYSLLTHRQTFYSRLQSLPRPALVGLALYILTTAVLLVIYPNGAAVRFALITFFLIAVYAGFLAWPDILSERDRLFEAYVLSFLFVVASMPWAGDLQIGDRFMGWFKDPNVLAAYTIPGMLMSISALAALKIDNVRKQRAWVLFGLFLAMVFGWTASRGAFLALGAGIAFIGVKAVLNKPIRFVRPALMAVVVLFLATGLWVKPVKVVTVRTSLAAQSVLEKATGVMFVGRDAGDSNAAAGGATDEKEEEEARTEAAIAAATGPTVNLFTRLLSGDPGRINNYKAGIHVALNNPLGLGPGNYEKHVLALKEEGQPFAGAAHSLYLRTWVEKGVLGVVALIFFFLSVLWLSLRLGRSAGGVWLSLSLASSIIAILLHSVLIDTLHWRHLWLVLALGTVAGLSTVSGGTDRTGDEA